MYSELPVIGWFVSQVEPVLLYNKRAKLSSLNLRKPSPSPQAALSECLQRLRDCYSIGIFPEGTRNPDPQRLRRGRLGVGVLALQAGVPVVPVGVDFPSRQRRGRIPALGQVILRIGKPLTFPAELAAYERLRGALHQPARIKKKLERFLAARITHGIMVELSRLSGKSYPFVQPAPPSEASDYLV